MKQLPLIPGYTIIKRLGHGGMADVYLGFQEKLARQVAIKVLDPLLLRDDQFARRFIKEAQTAAQLVYPHIVTIHDVGEVRDKDTIYYYIVMEYLEESLSERLKERGPLPPHDALDIVRKIAGALDYAHKKGFIHRDIKPDNIMFRTDGTVVLVDFGIARAMDSSTQLTRTGMSIGTPHYMSPEQCRGEKIDGRSDIYSLGVQLYEILTGEVPYKAENTAGIIIKHIQDPIPKLPGELSEYQPLIDRLMAKDAIARIQTGSDVTRFIDLLLSKDKKNLAMEFGSSQPTRVSAAHADRKITTGSTSPPSFTPKPATKTSTVKRPEAQKKTLLAVAASLIIVITGILVIALLKKPTPIPQPTGNTSQVNSSSETQGKILSPSTSTSTSSPGLSSKIINPPNNGGQTKQPSPTTNDSKVKPKTQNPSTTPKTPGKETPIKSQPPETPAANREKKEIPQEKPTSLPADTTKNEDTPVKVANLLDLPQETRMVYKNSMQRIEIQIMNPKMQVFGRMSVDLLVDEMGKVTMLSFEDALTVIPPRSRGYVLNTVRYRINAISLPPPKNKKGEPVRFRWRITYKIGKFGNKLFLNKE